MSTAEAAITAQEVSKIFFGKSGTTQALGAISTSIGRGEFVSIVGPSGCGKSTFLHILAGFTSPSGGSVAVRKASATDNLGYIFQKDTLLPWYTVRKNVGLGLTFHGARQAEIDARTDRLLELTNLVEFGSAYPHQLSGGMRRRVALAMSLATDPTILLLDEPFGALDTHTRTHLHRELLLISRRLMQTVVLVTHDLDEAITLSDRVLVFSGAPSKILLDEKIDIAHPRDVYTIRQTPEFAHHYGRVWNVLGEQFKVGRSE